jgi:hypothetical protein
MDLIEIYRQFNDYLKIDNLFVSGFRTVMWALIQGLKIVSDAFDSVVDKVYELVKFLTTDRLSKALGEYNWLIYSIGTICLVYFFIQYMRNGKRTQISSLLDNIMLGMGVILISTSLTAMVMQGAFGIAEAISGVGDSTANKVIKENIYDVTTFDSFNWQSTDQVSPIKVSNDYLDMLNPTETVKASDFRFENDVSKEIFENKLIINKDQKPETKRLTSGLFKLDEHYYRYSWHPWVILVQMLLMILVQAATSFKYTKSVFNAAYNAIIMPFFGFSDLIEGAKVKKIISSTINIAINIVMWAVTIMLYRLFTAYITTLDWNAIQKLIVTLFLTFALLEGPFIIQELTGQDGGIRSESKALLASGVAAAFGAKRLPGAIKSGADKVRDGFNKMRQGVTGAFQGIGDHMGSGDTLDSEMKAQKQTENKAPAPPNKEMSPEDLAAFESAVKSDLEGGKDRNQLPDVNLPKQDDLSAEEGKEGTEPRVAKQDAKAGGATKDGEPSLNAARPRKQLPGALAAFDGNDLVGADGDSLESGGDTSESANRPKKALFNLDAAKPYEQALSAAASGGQSLVPSRNVAALEAIKNGTALPEEAGANLELPPQAVAAALGASRMTATGYQQFQQQNAGNVLAQPLSQRALPTDSPMSQFAPSYQTTQTLSGTGADMKFAPSIQLPENVRMASGLQYMHTARSPIRLNSMNISNVGSGFTPMGPPPVSVPQFSKLPGSIQFKEDLAHVGMPLTADTYSDRRIDKRINKGKSQNTHQETHDLARNSARETLKNMVFRGERKDK